MATNSLGKLFLPVVQAQIYKLSSHLPLNMNRIFVIFHNFTELVIPRVFQIYVTFSQIQFSSSQISMFSFSYNFWNLATNVEKGQTELSCRIVYKEN